MRKENKKYQQQSREVPQEVNDKFIINGEKVSIYVKNEKEIEELIEYLNFDFVLHESRKNPSPTYIQNTEFIVSCKFNKSVIAEYRNESFLSIIKDKPFNDKILDALPLDVFLNPEIYPEYFI